MTSDQQPFDQDSDTENRRLRFALEAAKIGTWDLDISNQQVWWDECCKVLYGFHQQDKVAYQQVLSYIHPDDKAHVDQAVQWALNPQSEGHYDTEFRTIGANDGRLRWLHCKGKAYFDSAGIAYRFAGIAQDITETKSYYQQTKASESHFRSLIEQAPVAVGLFVGRDFIIELANAPILAFWGKGSAVLGKPLAEVLPELVEQPFLAILEKVYATGRAYHAIADRCELRIDGQLRTFYFNFTYQPIVNELGQVYAILNMAVDVTPQVLARQQLEASEAFARSLFHSSPVANLVLTGEAMTIQMSNEGMLNMLGRDNRILGQPFMEAMPELQNTPIMDRLRSVLATGETYYQPEERIELVRYGQPYTGYYNYIYTALGNAAGSPTGVVVTAIEVTQQVVARQAVEVSEEQYRRLSTLLEQQVQQRTQELALLNKQLLVSNEELITSNEELEESNGLLIRSNANLQTFAYVASHDLQEPLRKIQQFGDLLKTTYPDSTGEGVRYIGRMQSAAYRMSILIRDLLNFSRISTQREVGSMVSLATVVNQVLLTLELPIEETGAQIDVDSLPTINGDESQLNQLFQNLFSNALKFRQPGIVPQIQVRVTTLRAEGLPPTVKPTQAALAYHRIDVADNGIGFDETYLDRIFQVFQRLHGKSQFPGTGIGLAICERVVANHGGAITATSQPGQGATFSIYLPM